MKRFLSLVLMLCICSFAFVACSEGFSTNDPQDMVVMRADEFFNSYSVGVSKQGSGRLLITFSVTAVETSAVLGVSSYDIQQKINGVWTTVDSYISGYTATNRISTTFSDYYSGTAGNEYRVYARFYCQKNSGASKTNGVYSGSITAN